MHSKEFETFAAMQRLFESAGTFHDLDRNQGRSAMMGVPCTERPQHHLRTLTLIIRGLCTLDLC